MMNYPLLITDFMLRAATYYPDKEIVSVYPGETFVYNYGEWHRELAERLWDSRKRAGVAEEYFRYPMLKRIAETSRAVVVHNPAAARMVRRHCPSARIREIPHLCLPSDADPVEAERLRASWGFPGGCFVFGVLGFLRETKQLPLVLKALDAVTGRGANVGLVVAGEFVSSDLERLVTPLLARPAIRREPWSDARRFHAIGAAVDACINLRQPAAGETSGVGVRMMGLGKPVIASDGEETAGLPREACLRVAPGVGELDELTEYMLLLAQSLGLAREIGLAAAAHVRAAHAPEAVAAAYWELLCECRN